MLGIRVGDFVGAAEGATLGFREGFTVGSREGRRVLVGPLVLGWLEGCGEIDGADVGLLLGALEGRELGRLVGQLVGILVGSAEGRELGRTEVGKAEAGDGALDGCMVGTCMDVL